MTAIRTRLLEDVSASLVDAHAALEGTAADARVEEALVDLCRASLDALQRWEEERPSSGQDTRQGPRWRTALDELRVQAALAELELRSSHDPGAQVVDALVRAVGDGVAAARRDLGEALSALRTGLRDQTR